MRSLTGRKIENGAGGLTPACTPVWIMRIPSSDLTHCATTPVLCLVLYTINWTCKIVQVTRSFFSASESQQGEILPHWEVSGNIWRYGCVLHSGVGGDATGIWWLEVSDVFKQPAVCRTAPPTGVWLNMVLVLRFRDLPLSQPLSHCGPGLQHQPYLGRC